MFGCQWLVAFSRGLFTLYVHDLDERIDDFVAKCEDRWRTGSAEETRKLQKDLDVGRVGKEVTSGIQHSRVYGQALW